MKQLALPLVLLLVLTGCGLLPSKEAGPPASITGPSAEQPAAASLPQSGVSALGAQSMRADVLDTTTAEEKAAALASPAKGGEQQLGKVVVALGPPAEQGLWLKTSLVTEVVQGRIETAAGKSLALELRPGTGGALMSLGAYQALGLSLTALPELTVYRQ
jgi:hypothetical protein